MHTDYLIVFYRYWFYLLIISMVFFGLFTGWLAQIKGYNYGAWFCLGFFTGFIALITIGFAPMQDENAKCNDNKDTQKPKIKYGGLNDEL